MKAHKKIGQRNRKIYSMSLKGFKTKIIAQEFGLSIRRTNEIIQMMQGLDNRQ